MRVVLLQAGCAALVAIAFWIFAGAAACGSSLVGGLIVAPLLWGWQRRIARVALRSALT